MRISDWSSDVCSSDLTEIGQLLVRIVERIAVRMWRDLEDGPSGGGLVDNHMIGDRQAFRGVRKGGRGDKIAKDILCPFQFRRRLATEVGGEDRKSTRLNSSH